MLRAVLMLVVSKLLLKNHLWAEFNAHTRQTKKCQISATHISGTPRPDVFPKERQSHPGLSE